MGREIRRVPLDFDHPIGKVWPGFLNPHYAYRRDCPFCDGTHLNPETKQIDDDWYDFGHTGRRWRDSITDDEVAALIEAGRLIDFTHRWTGEEWKPLDPPRVPTAAEVNEWSRHKMGHDAINKWICVKARATRLGVYGHCPHCDEDGGIWRTPEDRAAYEAWTPTDPPTGEAWQAWETTSEGSPISPPCASPEALARWLTDNNASAFGGLGATYEQWLAFCGQGWAVSAIAQGGTIQSGVAACEAVGVDLDPQEVPRA